MKMQYHHMNLCTENVPRLSEFYRSVFGLGSVNYQRVNASDAAATSTSSPMARSSSTSRGAISALASA